MPLWSTRECLNSDQKRLVAWFESEEPVGAITSSTLISNKFLSFSSERNILFCGAEGFSCHAAYLFFPLSV